MVAAGIFASRIVGLVRNRVFTHYFGTSDVADAFQASRIAREPGGAFGRLPAGTDCAAILARALQA